MKNEFERLEKHWLWQWATRNLRLLVGIFALIGFIIIYFILPVFNKPTYKILADEKPNVKVMSVSYEGKVYQESPTTKSEAINFIIPIRNEGDGEAFDVQIKKKVLDLPRSTFDLSTSSLQTPITATPFDLPERKIVLDSIFIDDTPEHMQQVKSGKKLITIEYEIIYYSDKNKKNGYIYTYKNFTTDGVFREDTAEQRKREKP